jgi:hypothetical protein
VVAAEEGNDGLMRDAAAVLAEEVHDIRFEFYDGQQWQQEWPPLSADETTPELPLAVHIVLYLKPRGFSPAYADQPGAVLDLSTFPQRRLIVPLPAAELPDPSATTTNPSSGSPSSSGSGASGTNPTGSSATGGTGAKQ